MRFEELSVGMEVFWNPYGGWAHSGKIIALKERGSVHAAKACIEKSDTWEVQEIDKLFATRHEAVMHKAVETQREASNLLSRAAQMFQEAGIVTGKQE